jgi:DNA polymerase I
VKDGARVTIVSSDKDLMQLVNDKVEMFDPMRERPIRAAEVKEKFGVGPDKVIDVQALCGDSVDNVPGVPGIGVKTAAELINQYGDLENLLKKAGEIKQPKRRQSLLDHAEDARISKRLVTLDDHVKLPRKLAELEAKPIDPEKLAAFLRAQNFKSLLNRLAGKLGEAAKAAPEPKAAARAAPKEPEFAPPEPGVPPAAAVKPSAPDAPADLAKAKHRYELVQDLVSLESWIAEATLLGEVAVDTETTSLDASLAELVGVSLALEPGRACYIPLGHVAGGQGALDLGGDAKARPEAPRQIPLKAALAKLKPLLEDDSVLKIGQNIKYDIAVLARYGIAVAPIDCTMLISFVLEAGLHGHGLDELAKLHFGHDTIKYKDVAGSGKSHTGFAAVALDKARDYAAEDADYTLRLHRLLKPRLLSGRHLAFYETTERAMPEVVAQMEAYGIKVDATQLRRASEDFAKRMGELEVEIHKLAGHPFNIASPQQLGKVLFDELKLSFRPQDQDRRLWHRRRRAGGTRVRTRAPRPGARLAPAVEAQIDLCRRAGGADQSAHRRVHTSYALAGASTGRLASNDPNLQNIPVRTEEGRKIRRAFVAEKGHVLLSADYSQIELRLLAHVADIAALKDRPSPRASTSTPPPPARCSACRSRAWTRICGGAPRRSISASSTASAPSASANQLGIPRPRRRLHQNISSASPASATTWRNQGLRARTRLCRPIFGRAAISAASRTRTRRCAVSPSAPPSTRRSRAAADIIKRAMRRIPPALEKAGLSARMLLQVHDELVFEGESFMIDEMPWAWRGLGLAIAGLAAMAIAVFRRPPG